VTYETEPTQDEDATMNDSAEAAVPSTSTSTAATSSEKEFPLIVRATDGKGKKDIKVKLSTIVSLPSSASAFRKTNGRDSQVQPNDYLSFTDQYTSILRSNLTSGLRPKRKRANATSSKRSKSKSTKTQMTGEGEDSERRNVKGVGFVSRLPKVVGPRRGNGRKKRTAAQERRDQAVKKIRKAREERMRRSGETL